MGNYIPLFYVDVITYPCPSANVGLANPVDKRGLRFLIMSSLVHTSLLYHVHSVSMVAVWCLMFCDSGARLTKAYGITIQRYRKSHTKIKVSKMLILWCMDSKFCLKFQRFPFKFHKKFLTHTAQNMHFTRCWMFDNLWYLRVVTS